MLNLPAPQKSLLGIWSTYCHFYRFFQFIYKYLRNVAKLKTTRTKTIQSSLIRLLLVRFNAIQYLLYFAFVSIDVYNNNHKTLHHRNYFSFRWFCFAFKFRFETMLSLRLLLSFVVVFCLSKKKRQNYAKLIFCGTFKMTPAFDFWLKRNCIPH